MHKHVSTIKYNDNVLTKNSSVHIRQTKFTNDYKLSKSLLIFNEWDIETIVH